MHESVGETLFGRGVPAREGRLTHLGQRMDGQTDRQTELRGSRHSLIGAIEQTLQMTTWDA